MNARFKVISKREENKKRGRRTQSFFALFLFCTTLFLSQPTTARAAAGQHSVGFGLGQIILMGDFSKFFSDNLGFNIKYSYEASQMFGLMTDISLSSHSSADSANTLTLKGLTPNLRINLVYVDQLIVYAFTGFGLFMVDEKIGALTGSVITLGFDMGAAVNLALSPHFLFGTQLSFHNIFGKTDPQTVTASYPNGLSIGGNYLALMLNLMYLF